MLGVMDEIFDSVDPPGQEELDWPKVEELVVTVAEVHSLVEDTDYIDLEEVVDHQHDSDASAEGNCLVA